MASKIGFKRLTVRVLDGQTPTPDKNLFVIEGADSKGATQTAKINGLSAEPVKTYGSDMAYYVARRGVGDVTVDLELIDVPEKVLNIILGYTEKNGIAFIGADTEAPYCSILMETTTADGKTFAYGFFKGVLSMDSEEFKTLEGKVDTLPNEKFKFTASASDKQDYSGQYMGKLSGGDPEKVTEFKKLLEIEAG